MKKVEPSIIVYFIAVCLVLVAILTGNETLKLLSRSAVLPSLLFYYFQKSKKVRELYIICLLFCFLGEIIIMLYQSMKLVWEIIVFFCSYLILIKCGLDDISLKKIKSYYLFFWIGILLFLGFLLFTILDFINEPQIDLYLTYLFFGLILITLFCVSMLNYFTNSTISSLYFSAMALCVVLSDVFFSFYRFIDQLLVFNCINVFFQLISYYFMVMYFIERKPKLV